MSKISTVAELEQCASTCTKCLDDKLKGADDKRHIVLCGGTGCLSSNSKEIMQKFEEVLAAKGSDGSVSGYVMSLTAKEGYGGAITLSMGVKTDGTITGLSVLEASETAGLGAKCKEPEWQAQFPGKHGPNMEVVKGGGASETQIDAISGATITSKAITKAVNAGLKFAEELSK